VVDAEFDNLATIGEIAAEIAHELRNGLQTITNAAYLARTVPGSAAAQLKTIESEARNAQGIVDDLLGLARGDAARTAPCPMGAIIAGARTEFEPEEATWIDDLPDPAPTVSVHERLFTRVLRILYENAIAVSRPRRVSITTRALREPDGSVILRVSDDGPGVPEDLRETLFAPLVTARPGGTGLGLALAHRIVRAHGASIALVDGGGDGHETGAGATFEIRLGPATNP
jgi:signal transduction histidine kinase